MILEVRTIEDYSLADIFILDLDKITVAHVAKYTLSVIKKIEICAMVSLVKNFVLVKNSNCTA